MDRFAALVSGRCAASAAAPAAAEVDVEEERDEAYLRIRLEEIVIVKNDAHEDALSAAASAFRGACRQQRRRRRRRVVDGEEAWNALARRQLSSRLIDAASRPHLPLLHLPAASLPDPLRLAPSLRALASRLDPLPLALSSLASPPSSPDAGVLFLAPTPSAALLGIHAQLCELLRKDAGVEVPDVFRPDHWVPRCAVAVDVPRGRMAEAFCVLRELKLLPVSGYGMDIALVEVGPVVRELVSYPLGGSGGAGAD
ncbi:hypothetical protein OsJ_29153 [Oryza sativa Japonica Group]|uniref:Uncharacterized protein n=1 Tax=Oryza sativa subsp. japonica TaxID=39947 RepID=B9G3A3_ORYSJ|nr:hypothetical protein OsJ_29153 [Oryza sativa Japonica Group]